MPNHAHLVFAPLQIIARDGAENALGPENSDQLGTQDRGQDEYYAVARILHSIKGFTAREANKILNRKGQFWQHESYDHAIRDEEERQRVIDYVLNNPVKAGFVTTWQDWPHAYLRM